MDLTPEQDRLTRTEWLTLLTLMSRDPSLPVGRRWWASWMVVEMISARLAKPADVLRGVTGV